MGNPGQGKRWWNMLLPQRRRSRAELKRELEAIERVRERVEAESPVIAAQTRKLVAASHANGFSRMLNENFRRRDGIR